MSSYRSYVPWSKSTVGSSYSGTGSSYVGTAKSSEGASSKPASADSKNDSSYSARRYGSAGSTNAGTNAGTPSSYRPSTYTPTDRTPATPSKYGASATTTSPSSYLAAKDKDKYSTPSASSTASASKDTKEAERSDHRSIREKYNMGPALPDSPPKSGKEATDKPLVSHRQSLIDKYSTSRSTDKKDETPSSTSSYTRSLSRTPAKPEPEPEKPTSYAASLTPYRLYGRTTSPYTRSSSRDESSAATTPSSLRYGRYSTTPTTPTPTPTTPTSPRPSVTSPTPRSGRTSRQDDEEAEVKAKPEVKATPEVKAATAKVAMRSVAVVTRGTSPTAPSTSSFLRARRADLARVIEKTVERPVTPLVETADKEVQSDRGDDTARLSRYGSTSRATASPWSSYLDRFPTPGYSPAVAKYSSSGSSSSRGYGSTTARGDREATVTTTSPTPKAVPEAVLPVDAVAATKATPANVPDESVACKKEDAVGACKTKPMTELAGLKRAPSFTRVADVVLKRVGSTTKVEDKAKEDKAKEDKAREDKAKEATATMNADKKPAATTKKSEDTKSEIEKKPASKKVEVAVKTAGESRLAVDKKPAAKVDEADKPALVLKQALAGKDVLGAKKTETKTDVATPTKTPEDKKSVPKKSEEVAKTPEDKKPVPKKSEDAAKTPEDKKPVPKKTEEVAKTPEDKKPVPKKSEEPAKATSEPKVKALCRSPSAAKLDDAKTSASTKPGGDTSPPRSAKSKVGEEATKATAGGGVTASSGETQKAEDVDVLKGALAGLIRANAEKPPIRKAVSKADSLSESEPEGEKVMKKKKPLKKLVTKTDSLSETESDNLKLKSASPSESDSKRTPPLSPPPTLAASLAKLGSPSTNRKLLPPVAPRAAVVGDGANKDFRKSPLNADVSASEAAQLTKQRLASGKTARRSASASSDDASESPASASASVSQKQSALAVSKSTSKLASPAPSSTPPAAKPTEDTTAPQPPTNRKPASSGSESDSSESSTSSSSSSGSDDEAEETPSRSSASRAPTSPASNKLQEASLADKPPRPPASPKPPKEEAKSFLMRALAPVTNLFKSRAQEDVGSVENLSEHLLRSESSVSLSKATAASDREDGKKAESEPVKAPHKIRHVESGERAWWLDSNSNIPDGVQRVKSSKSVSMMSSGSETDSKKKDKGLRKHKIRHIESGERAWWLDSNDSIPEDAEAPRKSSGSETDAKKKERGGGRRHKIRHVESGERAWWLDNNDSIPEDAESVAVPRLTLNADIGGDETSAGRKIRRQESGERAWWLDSNPNIPEGVERVASSSSVNKPSGAESDQDALLQANAARLKLNRIRKQESGERAWWLDSNPNIPEGVRRSGSAAECKESSAQAEANAKKFAIRRQESGEKAWWMNSSSSDLAGGVHKAKSTASLAAAKQSDSSDESAESDASKGVAHKKGALPCFPLEVAVVETTGRTSPYDNVLDKAPVRVHRKRPKNRPLFISKHTNIDDILGTAASSLGAQSTCHLASKQESLSEDDDEDDDDDDDNCEEVEAAQVRIHDSTAKQPTIRRIRDDSESVRRRQSLDKLDDTALQLYKDGDYGSYLDLEASISEQQEEFDGFQANRKNSIVLRTQLSVRVHTIIEKLLNSEGRELRRALFSLKQIFQEDKDLVHEFVQNDGLACLIKVGSEADQNYQNYILRALGQVMLYVDGMNGVMEHNRTVQWLYTLIASKFRLVVKTALKLLLVFVEYVDSNCMLLIKAVKAVDSAQGLPSWSNVMRLVKDYDSADTELLTYATTLVNKTLNGVPDQDTYYDQVDALEEQGVEGAIQRYMSKQGTDLDLLRQFQIYEAVLHHEDGEEKGTPLRQLDETIRKTLRNRQSPAATLTLERRKSRRHTTGTSKAPPNNNVIISIDDGDDTGSSSSRSSPGPGEVPHLNGSHKGKQTEDAGVTPALRRRRERAERQRSFIREQQETSASLRATRGVATDGVDDENELSPRVNGSFDGSNKLNRVSSRKDLTPLMNAANKLDAADDVNMNAEDDRRLLLNLKRESTVKDLTQKLASQNALNSPTEEKVISRIGDMSGLISKAKEGLAKSKSKVEVLKSASGDVLKMVEAKKSETELHWEELVNGMKRPLELCDLDFTDLHSDDELDVLSPVHACNGVPPPPPPAPLSPVDGRTAPPPPPPNRLGSFVPPPCPTTPTSFGVNLRHQRATTTSPEKGSPQTPVSTPSSKTKKTVKLFWKEVRDDPLAQRLQKTGMIWDELGHVAVDTQKLEHLFESRAKDLITKKQQEMNKSKEIIVLDHKRSNAINIGMTKLPPPRSIKTAILKMDATIMTREGIEKLLTMLPTEDEQSKIQEAQLASPDVPLGSAEQFLLTLASISELSARLKLWAFKLDYDNNEKEVADPLMDLKQGVETLRVNKTFRGILSTLLSIGIFLNGTEVKGFQIEYLAKVPEVKDTVHKHSLLHHLCHMVMEQFPEATDLYSEIGAVTRASKVDFDELAANIHKMEAECKASWDHLKDIAKHDGSTAMKVKMTDFLADCAERIIVLGVVHRRVMNRYHKFLLWLGVPLFRVGDTKPSEFCRVVSEFALEYRTTRERVLLQLEKKANHRERNKTRGKMITEVGKFRTKEDRADAELRHLLGTHAPSDLSDVEGVVHGGTLPWRRQRKDGGRTVLGPLARAGDDAVNGNVTDGDDEILESLVKTATKAPAARTMPRERKRTRHADRKSIRRTLKNGLSEEDKKHLAAYIKGY